MIKKIGVVIGRLVNQLWHNPGLINKLGYYYFRPCTGREKLNFVD